jgi:hypothetical protein
MSEVGWIDFSSEHREKVRAVLDLLKVKGVVDELGIGVVRNTFSDSMFPGITTVQTRAKYYPLTALLIARYGKERKGAHSMESYMAREEISCRIQLVTNAGDPKNLGIVGSSFGVDRSQGVKRRPSSIYWNGLRAFGIIPPALTFSEYDRRLNQPQVTIHGLLESTRDASGDDWDAESLDRISVSVPPIEDEESYFQNLEIDLTPVEAKWLREQITSNQPDSLTSKILISREATDQLLRLPSPPSFQEFADLPFVQKLDSGEMIRNIELARDFAILLGGAYIRYYYLLQERFGSDQDKETMLSAWEKWRRQISDFPKTWDIQEVWSRVNAHGSKVYTPTRNFVKDWIAEAQNGAKDADACDRLVIQQEWNNKKNRARLRPRNTGEDVRGWVNPPVYNYRLTQVQQLVQDIADGEGSR